MIIYAFRRIANGAYVYLAGDKVRRPAVNGKWMIKETQ